MVIVCDVEAAGFQVEQFDLICGEVFFEKGGGDIEVWLVGAEGVGVGFLVPGVFGEAGQRFGAEELKEVGKCGGVIIEQCEAGEGGSAEVVDSECF